MKIKSLILLIVVTLVPTITQSQKRLCATPNSFLEVPSAMKESPRLWYSTERLGFLRKAYIEKQGPHYLAVTKVMQQAHEALYTIAKPYMGKDQLVFLHSAAAHSKQAVCLALAYHITGDVVFQKKAIEIVLTYVKESPNGLPDNLDLNNRFSDTGLSAYCGTSGMVLTYDLLLNTNAFNIQNKKRTEAWLRKLVEVYKKEIKHWDAAYVEKDGVWVKSNNPKDPTYFGGQYYQNHVAEHLMGILQIGYTLGDRQLIQYCIDSKENPRDLKTMISGAIHMTGDKDHYVFPDTVIINRVGAKYKRDLSKNNWNMIPPETGEMYDRYRTISGHGLGYSLLCFNLLLQAAELTWQNGIDFYRFTGKNGQNLLLPFQYYADFAITADASIKSGYYVWSDLDFELGKSLGTYFELWELGAIRYPEKATLFDAVLTSKYYSRGNVSLYNIHTPIMSWFLVAGAK